jgi:hypothetical protein
MPATPTLIEKSIKNSYAYSQYRQHITQLLEQGLSTGATQSEALTHYSTLNEVRMNRLDKTLALPDEMAARLTALKKGHTLLVISEGWCGDAAQILPVINLLAETNPQLDLRIVLRDDNPELMDEYLTNGGRSIPKLILVEKDSFTPRASWGPRPHGAVQLIAEYKEKFGGITDEVKTALQKWYLQDKGHSTMQEIILLLENSENM